MSKWVQKLAKKSKKIMAPSISRLLPSCIALLFVWSATGLWHGGSWSYLLWGWINLFCILSSMLLKPVYDKAKKICHISDENKVWKLYQMSRTFMIFGFAEMVSDKQSITGTISLCKSLFTECNWNVVLAPLELLPGLKNTEIIVLIISVLLMYMVDVLKEKQVNIYELLHRWPTILRYTFYVALFYIVILFGYTGVNVAEGFMYAQF
jgi:hypothetical protein